MKIKNKDCTTLIHVYKKLINIDFDFAQDESNIENAVKLVEDFYSIQDAIKAYGDLEKAVIEKVESKRDEEGKIDQKVIEKANKDLIALAETEVSFNKIFQVIKPEYIKKIQIKPVELFTLKEVGLY
jgi:hypothetical protein